MKRSLFVLFILLSATTAYADDYIMLKINDDQISAAQVQNAWQKLFPADAAPAFETSNKTVKHNVLRGIISEQLLYREASKQGIETSAEFKQALAEAKRKLLIQQLLARRGSSAVSDDAIAKEYARQVAATKGEKEIRARHILVDKKQQAEDIIKKLGEGKNFADLAAEFSKDPGSAEAGGDLGYFTAEAMLPEFSEAAFKLAKGEVSGPVKTSFGWHIIQVDDVRKATLPPLAQMREAIREQLQKQALSEYVQGLLEGANVTIYDAKGNESPFNKSAKKAKVK